MQRALLFLVGVTLPLQAFSFFNIGGFGMTPFKLAAGGLFALAAMSFAFGRRALPDATKTWLAVFAVTYGVSAIQGVLRGVSLRAQLVEASTFYLLLLYYLMIGFVVRTRSDLLTILWGLVVGGLVTAVPAVLGLQTASDIGRHEGLSGQPNIFGIDMVITIAVALALLGTTRKTSRRSLLMGASAIALMGVFLSLSRTAFLAGMSMWGMWVIRSRRIDTIRYVVPAAVLLLAVMMLAPVETRDRFITIFDTDRYQQDGSIQSRFVQLELGGEAFLSNPAFGIGVLHYIQWAGNHPKGRGNTHVIHNSYLRIAVAQGLFGLVPYLMILLMSWRHYSNAARISRRGRRLKDPLLSELGRFGLFLQLALLGVIVSGLTAHAHKSKTGWLMLGLAPVVYRMTRERAEELEGSAATAGDATADSPFEPFPGSAPALRR